MKSSKRPEGGYILITVLVIVFIITLATVILSEHTLNASFFAVRRSETVSAFALAENAAMEGFWQLTRNPDFRGTQERHWGGEWYQYSIVDSSPGALNDLTLDIIGRGYVQGTGSQRTLAVRLHLSRTNTATVFKIDSEIQENN